MKMWYVWISGLMTTKWQHMVTWQRSCWLPHTRKKLNLTVLCYVSSASLFMKACLWRPEREWDPTYFPVAPQMALGCMPMTNLLLSDNIYIFSMTVGIFCWFLSGENKTKIANSSYVNYWVSGGSPPLWLIFFLGRINICTSPWTIIFLWQHHSVPNAKAS